MDPHRRNYSGLLGDVAASGDLISNSRFSLEIFSYGELAQEHIPASLKQKVHHHHLNYTVRPACLPFPLSLRRAGPRPHLTLSTPPGLVQEYYAEMHRTLAMLTLFPSDRYYTQASSSTVATAISLGLPLAVQPRFLEVRLPRQPSLPLLSAKHWSPAHTSLQGKMLPILPSVQA